MAFIFALVSAILLFLQPTLAATPAEWRSRSIYQVVTDRFALPEGTKDTACDATLGNYCGGTWKGIESKLDYIEGMGFDAIWISPITKQLESHTGENESYHGYWQQNLYEVNEHFGTAQDLKDLADALHKRDMYLMIDVVVGHVAWPGPRDTVNYTVFVPFNKESDFHPDTCLTADAGDNANLTQTCWLGDDVVSLPDLRNEDEDIANVLIQFVADTVTNFTADGIRIDSVINLDPGFLPGLNKASGVYCIGEVLQGDTTEACPYQDRLDGFIDYPLYFPIIRLLKGTSGHVQDLVTEIEAIRNLCKDPTLLGTFSENHDNPRFASYTSDMSLASNALTFDIMFDGIPIIYYGQEQHFSGTDSPLNREPLWPSGYNITTPLYKLSATLNGLRKAVIQKNDTYLDYLSNPVYSDDHNIAFRKGYDGNQIISVFNNNGANGVTFELNVLGTGFAEGTNVTDVVSCSTTLAGTNGTLPATITNGMPAVYAATSFIIDKTIICQPAKEAAAASSSAASSIAATATATATKSTASATSSGSSVATGSSQNAASSIGHSLSGLLVCIVVTLLIICN